MHLSCFKVNSDARQCVETPGDDSLLKLICGRDDVEKDSQIYKPNTCIVNRNECLSREVQNLNKDLNKKALTTLVSPLPFSGCKGQ